ncbi:hypothetical protein IWQ51_004232 [Labrenzia sp. EL_142]|nr:hypothetical protein [Labrenzia sp. EL_142]
MTKVLSSSNKAVGARHNSPPVRALFWLGRKTNICREAPAAVVAAPIAEELGDIKVNSNHAVFRIKYGGEIKLVYHDDLDYQKTRRVHKYEEAQRECRREKKERKREKIAEIKEILKNRKELEEKKPTQRIISGFISFLFNKILVALSHSSPRNDQPNVFLSKKVQLAIKEYRKNFYANDYLADEDDCSVKDFVKFVVQNNEFIEFFERLVSGDDEIKDASEIDGISPDAQIQEQLTRKLKPAEDSVSL